MRLNRYLAACGFGSRRGSEDWIRAGRVTVNGRPADLSTRVGPGDTVMVDGQPARPDTSLGVWLLHKPAGLLCTARDELGRRTVFDLAREAGLGIRLFSVGRLDMDTTGLLLLTNDGALAHRLTHPSQGVEKEYEAVIASELAEPELARLQSGVDLDDGRTSPCTVTQERAPGGTVLVRLVLHEGRKRQVRRMLAAVGAPVLTLHRVRVGTLRLGGLPSGAIRRATPAEVEALQAACERAESRAEASPGEAPRESS